MSQDTEEWFVVGCSRHLTVIKGRAETGKHVVDSFVLTPKGKDVMRAFVEGDCCTVYGRAGLVHVPGLVLEQLNLVRIEKPVGVP